MADRIAKPTGIDVVGFEAIDRTQIGLVGGKGAHLGELSRIEGVRVPPGFCVTTGAYLKIVAATPSIQVLLDRLSQVPSDDPDTMRAIAAEIRETIEGVVVPDDLVFAIREHIIRLGKHDAWAVRSSATAEDLPTMSFAGQQDTYLNVIGAESIILHIAKCWASLFTERAVIYRQRNGIDHRKVQMAVVVQKMVFPHAAGIMFTADPVSGNRRVVSIEASFGLGEVLVSGLVSADTFIVRDGEIVGCSIGTKERAIVALPNGGTHEATIALDQQTQPALTDAQAVRLAALGRRLEAHFGRPQDIEWCLADDVFQIVQSRPITTLFPIPANDDGESYVYVSVGHQQMMTDPMTPLGLSVWQMTVPRPMAEAGGRLYVDVTRALEAPGTRAGLLEALGKSDLLIRDALQTVLDRGDIVRTLPDDGSAPVPPFTRPEPIATDPAIVTGLVERTQASIAALKQEIQGKTGTALLDLIADDIPELKRILFDPLSHQVFMTAIEASWWLNEHMQEWLGVKNAADALTQSVPHNVTSEMGLALMDVADAIRPYPEVVACLEHVDEELLLDGLTGLAGGREARDAILAFLETYGMRCVGEIDITRPRWSERPDTLVPMILGNIRNFAAGERMRRFERGRQEAEVTAADLLERLRALPNGEQKAAETSQMIDRVRTFMGYREYPKYGKVCRTFVYKQALMQEADRLVEAGVIADREDIFFLRFEELRDVVRTGRADTALIAERRVEFTPYQALTPPRVLTSDGEGINGAYRRDDVPEGALVGLPVSGGTVEGRARVILDLADADLEPGDILVTTFTDPSWTPLFVAIAGLVTEVGGMMTHGAVIAREYGLPAIVGVANATTTIQDGQRIRLHGSDGYLEILG